MRRRPSSVGLVTVPVLLRLLREPLAAGRLVGEAELVETGERILIRDARQLIACLRDRARPQGGGPGAADTPRDGAALRPREEKR